KGYAEGVDGTADARLSIREIEGDLATEELYKDDVLKKVSVGEPEIRRGMAESRSSLRVRWLYRKDIGAIGADAARMQGGALFDSLFAEQCRGNVHPEDRSMEATRFKVRMRNPALTNVLDTLDLRACSAPVQGPDGWYILRIDDAWKE